MQEVSQYADMERGLGPAGYTGVFAPRPGGRRKDGCATFYKVGIPGCPRGGVQWGHWCELYTGQYRYSIHVVQKVSQSTSLLGMHVTV